MRWHFYFFKSIYSKIKFVSLFQTAWAGLEVLEYSDDVCMLAKDGGRSDHLRTVLVLGLAIPKSIILHKTYLIGNSYPKLLALTKLRVLKEPVLNGRKIRFAYRLERTSTEIHMESQIDSLGRGKEAPQDKYHFC